MKYDLFVDESCHLEHDKISVMCIGYVKVPQVAYSKLKADFGSIKKKHNVKSEIKWSKFSKLRMPLYKNLVDYFFASPMEFRCVLIKYKDRLNNKDFNQGSHDNFYYKMTYFLLRPNPATLQYRVFMDIKDTRGRDKLRKIEDVFQNYHHGESPYVSFQHLRSHENHFFQLTDLFIGAIAYKNRVIKGELEENKYKMEFVRYLEEKSGFLLDSGTAPWESKFNIFDHQPKMY